MDETPPKSRPLNGRTLLVAGLGVGLASALLVFTRFNRHAPTRPHALAHGGATVPRDVAIPPARTRRARPPGTPILLAASGLIFALLAYASLTGGQPTVALLWGVVAALQWAVALNSAGRLARR